MRIQHIFLFIKDGVLLAEKIGKNRHGRGNEVNNSEYIQLINFDNFLIFNHGDNVSNFMTIIDSPSKWICL